MYQTAKYSEALRATLIAARRRAVERRQAFCTSEQVLEQILLDRDEPAAARPLTTYLDGKQALPFDPPDAEFSKALRNSALPAAEKLAAEDLQGIVEPNHLLRALLGVSSPIACDLREKVVRRLASKTESQLNGESKHGAASLCGDCAAPHDGEQSYLNPVVLGEQDEQLVERPLLLDRLMQVLLFGNPLLVGPVGSGRRSLIRLLARRLKQRRCPPALDNMQLLELDPTRLVAGTTYRGELEERARQIIQRLSGKGTSQVVVVEDVHLLLGRSESGDGTNVASAFLPHLRRGSFRMICCTTPDLLREKLEQNPVFLNALDAIVVDPPNASEAKELLASLPEQLMIRFSACVDPEVVEFAISQCRQHVPNLALPGVAQKLVYGAAATMAFEAAMTAKDPDRLHSSYWTRTTSPEGQVVPNGALTTRHILYELSAQHRIPFEHLDTGVEQKLEGLDQTFRSHIFGQDHVLPLIRNQVKLALMSLSDTKRPRGRLFFLGPPGTGKSECAKIIAKYLMGSEDSLLRFDMSEFQGESSLSSLIGSDKGLVGSEEGGRLTEPLRQNPHRVILFDEIEKAHPFVFNLFLQMLEYGELHDKRGCRVSFRHALCIFTSNQGCERDKDLFGLSRRDIESRLESLFRPEFLNRIEFFVPFRVLDRDARRRIVEFQLRKFAEQILGTHGIQLEWTDRVPDRASVAPPGEAGARDILYWMGGTVKPAVADALLDLSKRDLQVGVIRLDMDDDGQLVARTESLYDKVCNR